MKFTIYLVYVNLCVFNVFRFYMLIGRKVNFILNFLTTFSSNEKQIYPKLNVICMKGLMGFCVRTDKPYDFGKPIPNSIYSTKGFRKKAIFNSQTIPIPFPFNIQNKQILKTKTCPWIRFIIYFWKLLVRCTQLLCPIIKVLLVLNHTKTTF